MSDEVIEVEGEIVDDVVELPETVALDRHEAAQVDVQIATAHRFPRQLRRVADRLTTLATMDEETAQSCSYALKKGGTYIIGESVRFAELAVAAWGNVRCATRIVGETDDARWIIAEGTVWDLESNSAVACQVQRRLTDKNGRRYSDDVVQSTANAAASIALRNAVLRVIPKAFLRGPWLKARSVALGKAKSLGEKRSNVVSRLKALSADISDEMILGVVGRESIEDVTTLDLERLLALGTSIKDGLPVEEAFAPGDGTARAPGVGVAEVLQQQAKEKPRDLDPTPAAPEAPEQDQAGEGPRKLDAQQALADLDALAKKKGK